MQSEASYRPVATQPFTTSTAGRACTEIWADIFRRCIYSSFKSNARGGCWAPLRLSHVCHRWRAIIHGDPLAWTKIELRGDPAWKEHLHFWLSRSCDLPLDIRIPLLVPGVDAGLKLKTERTAIFSFGHLLSQCRAFHSLDIDISAPGFALLARTIAEHHRGSLQSLRHMSIYMDLEEYFPSPLSFELFRPGGVQSAGFLSGPPALPYSGMEPATFASLTTLTMPCGRGRDLNEIAAFLSCCPALEVLRMLIEFKMPPAPLNRTIAKLPRLERLVLSDAKQVPYRVRESYEEIWGSVWLLSALELPALQSLALTHCMVHVPTPQGMTIVPPDVLPEMKRDALRFMDARWDSLQDISLGPNDFGDERVCAWLPNLPNLEVARFVGVEPGPEILEILPVEVPKLRELEVDTLSPENVPALLDFAAEWSYAPHLPESTRCVEDMLILRVPGASVEEEELEGAVLSGQGRLTRDPGLDERRISHHAYVDAPQDADIHFFIVERDLPQ